MFRIYYNVLITAILLGFTSITIDCNLDEEICDFQELKTTGEALSIPSEPDSDED